MDDEQNPQRYSTAYIYSPLRVLYSRLFGAHQIEYVAIREMCTYARSIALIVGCYLYTGSACESSEGYNSSNANPYCSANSRNTLRWLYRDGNMQKSMGFVDKQSINPKFHRRRLGPVAAEQRDANRPRQQTDCEEAGYAPPSSVSTTGRWGLL